MKLKLGFLTFIVTTLLNITCAEQKQAKGSYAFIRPDFKEYLGVRRFPRRQGQDGSLPLWQRGSLQIYYKETASWLLSTTNPLASPESFVVSFPFASELSKRLRPLEMTIAYYPGTDKEFGFALIQPPTADDLYDIAQEAHLQAGGLGCGNVEKISGFPLSPNTIVHSYPLYEEHTALSSVQTLIKQVSAQQIKASMLELSLLESRGHNSPQGLATPEVLSRLAQSAAGSYEGISMTSLAADSAMTEQKNLIIRLPAQDAEEPAIIIGAHMDTILGRDSSGPAPGADDDASGLAVMIEVLRIIATNQMRFKRPIEFHAYAAEEIGLIGSYSLASYYRQIRKKVAAMLQLDMVAYAPQADDHTIYLVSNDTSSILRRSLKDLMNTYLDGGYQEMALSGGTSDHKSWTNLGFPSVFPFEHPLYYNKKIHTADDTLAYAQEFGLAARFAQLVLSFISHYGGYTQAASEYSQKINSSRLMEDIKLAFSQPFSLRGLWTVNAASTAEVSAIELCQVSGENNYSCTTRRISMSLLGQKNGRNFYSLDEELALATGDELAFFAYDKQNKIIGKRVIKLTAK